MAYIGNSTQNQNYVPAIDYFNGDGSTVAFTLSRPVASVAAVQAVISNVPQNPGSAFTVSGSTITFTSAPPSGTANIYVYYTSPNTQVVQPGQGTVGATQIDPGYALLSKSGSTASWSGNMALANGQQYCFGSNNYNGMSGSSVTNSLSFYTNNVQTMGIDSSGRVTMPYQPAFTVKNPGTNVSGPLVFSVALFNTGGHYSTSTGRFTAPVTGKYFFYFQGLMLANSADVRFNVNGATYSYYGESNEAGYHQLSLGLVFNLNAGDYVQPDIWGGTLYGADYSTFTGYLIG